MTCDASPMRGRNRYHCRKAPSPPNVHLASSLAAFGSKCRRLLRSLRVFEVATEQEPQVLRQCFRGRQFGAALYKPAARDTMTEQG